jgi:hypothetical protein
MLALYPPAGPIGPDAAEKWMLKGLDCSGLLYQATGGLTPRNARSLVEFGRGVRIAGLDAESVAKKLRPLDLIVWSSHVIVALDEDRVVESRLDYDPDAEGNQGGVRISGMRDALEDIMAERIPVDDYEESPAVKKFVVRRWLY